LDPILLLKRIRAAQHTIAGIEVRGGTVAPLETNQNLEQFVGNLGIARKAGEVRSTHRKPNTGPRYWRTRADPFQNTWPTIEGWLNEQPDANAKELFQRLHSNGFLLHVLPVGLVRIRHFGFLANRVRKQKLVQCRALLASTAPLPIDTDGSTTSVDDPHCCPICKLGRLAVIELISVDSMAVQDTS
jgi:hypothetical protein